jgi:hypothetical protein
MREQQQELSLQRYCEDKSVLTQVSAYTTPSFWFVREHLMHDNALVNNCVRLKEALAPAAVLSLFFRLAPPPLFALLLLLLPLPVSPVSQELSSVACAAVTSAAAAACAAASAAALSAAAAAAAVLLHC